MRDPDGRNVFSLTKDEIQAGGRKDCKYADMKYMPKEAEWFLAGLLDGLPDGG